LNTVVNISDVKNIPFLSEAYYRKTHLISTKVSSFALIHSEDIGKFLEKQKIEKILKDSTEVMTQYNKSWRLSGGKIFILT
jgi:hypothetical protein